MTTPRPLYMAAGTGELPSARRTRQRRVAQGSVALLAAVMSLVVIAVLVAPEPRRIADPIKAAREQFSMSASAVSVNEALGAVLLAFDRGADLGDPVSYTPLGQKSVDVVISPHRAAAWLRNADVDLDLTGTQRVWIADSEGHYRTADVRTTQVRGEGAQLEVLDTAGDRFSSSFLPQTIERPVEAPQRWRFAESLGAEPSLAGRRYGSQPSTTGAASRVGGLIRTTGCSCGPSATIPPAP